MDDLEFLGETEETSGLTVSDNYKIETADALNVVVKQKYTPQFKEGESKPEEQWRTISYHPNLELAFKSIVDREINLTASNGLEAVVARIEELKQFKKKISNL